MVASLPFKCRWGFHRWKVLDETDKDSIQGDVWEQIAKDAGIGKTTIGCSSYPRDLKDRICLVCGVRDNAIERYRVEFRALCLEEIKNLAAYGVEHPKLIDARKWAKWFEERK